MATRSATGKAGDGGTMKSPEDTGPSRPWTEEERAAAAPLPLPTVDDRVVTPATPATTEAVHSPGKGRATPGGRPEREDNP